MRAELAVAAALAAVLSCASARAEDSAWREPGARLGGKPWQFVLTAERFSAFSYWTMARAPVPDGAQTAHGTLSSAPLGASDTGAVGPIPYAMPRLSTDLVFPGDFTAGVAFGFFSAKSTGDHDLASSAGFVVAPRVGYLIAVSDRVAIWPRAGATVFRSRTPTAEIFGIATTIETLVTWSVVQHFALFLAPAADVGVWSHGSGPLTQAGVFTGGLGYF